MKKIASFPFCLMFFISLFNFFLSVNAQQNIINVSLEHKKELNIAYFPFNEIRVLDNRIDTAILITIEDGKYPVRALGFTASSYTIKKYIDEAINPLPKGDKSLLITIRQMRVTNKSRVLRKTSTLSRRSKRESYYYPFRSFILFSADAYIENDSGDFTKVLSIEKKYYNHDDDDVVRSLHNLLSELIESVAIVNDSSKISISNTPKKLKYLLKEVASFNYTRDTVKKSLSEINVNIKEEWKNYPIVKLEKANGVFANFDDFRNNHAYKTSFKIHKADSLYTIDVIKPDSEDKHFAVYAIKDSGTLYIRLFKNYYVELIPCGNTFCFYIPVSLPNMYAIISMENIESLNFSSTGTGNLLWDLGSLAFFGTIDAAYTTLEAKKIRKQGQTNFDYRKCYIDMNTGDFIY